MTNLPKSWIRTSIDMVTEAIEQREPTATEEITYIDISSVDREKKLIASPQKILGKDAPSRARKVVKSGDTLVSMTRPNLNAVALIDPRFDGEFASTGFDVLRTSVLDQRWLYYTVRTSDFVDAMSSLVQGALYPAVKSKDVRAYQIPLAPLPEQKRIADKLDSVLARVDACRERLARVQPLLKRFRQSVLAAATSGALTADWRVVRASAPHADARPSDYKSDAPAMESPTSYEFVAQPQFGDGDLFASEETPQEEYAASLAAGIEPASGTGVGCAGEGSPTLAENNTSWASHAQSNLLGNQLYQMRYRVEKELKGKRREEVLQLFSNILMGNKDLPNDWLICPVGTIGLVSNGSTPSRADESLWGSGISWVSSGEVRNNLIYETREQITEAGFESCSVKRLPPGSVLIAMIGEGKTRGQSATLKIEATINQNIAAVQPFNEIISSEYLWYSFQSKYEENRSEGSGTGPQALNCQRVRELLINLPPLPEQHEIVRRVETLFAFADRLEARLAAAQTAVERLTPALLAKAFRGELVPQDPNDEPAAELLKRLAETRAAAPKPKRGRKGASA